MRRLIVILICVLLTGCGSLRVQVQVVDPQAANDAFTQWTPAPDAVCPIAFFFGALPNRCPDAAAQMLEAAFQMFDGGYMLWEGGTSSVYILYNDGSYISLMGDVIATWDEVPVTELPPPHHFKPMRGFSRVWMHETEIRALLGWPFGIEQAFTTPYQTSHDASGIFLYMTLPNSQVIEFSPDGTWQVIG